MVVASPGRAGGRRGYCIRGTQVNFDLDEQQTMLRDLMARFTADRSHLERRMADRRDARGFDPAGWAMLAELGLLALPFAEENGGLGGGMVEIATVAEEIGCGLAIEPWLSDLMLAGRLLERAGNEAQRNRWLPQVIAGEARLALAFAEPRGRYNPLAIATAARGDRLSGAKTFVQAGVGVDAYLITARDESAAGIGIWVVPADAEGLDVRPYRLTDGSVACELTLVDVAGERLEGGNAGTLGMVLDDARIAACAEMVGTMEMLQQATLDYLRTRKQFGQAIGAFQAIQHRMAQVYALVEQSRSQLLRAVLAPDDASRPAVIAGAKAFISESAVRMGEECIQFHGGMGVSDELVIGHGHKRILLLAGMFGDADAELSRYSRLMLG